MGPAKTDKTIFVLVPPTPESPGKYALLISRGGFGSQPLILFVDRLVEGKETYTAMLGRKKVAAFPKPTPFLLLDRAYAILMSPVEVAKMHKAEEMAVSAVMEVEAKDQEPGIPLEISHPGKYL